jgi:hypothetical protein
MCSIFVPYLTTLLSYSTLPDLQRKTKTKAICYDMAPVLTGSSPRQRACKRQVCGHIGALHSGNLRSFIFVLQCQALYNLFHPQNTKLHATILLLLLHGG